jgi:hypothetical protein
VSAHNVVMVGLDPTIHVFVQHPQAWMLGTKPSMTRVGDG